MSKPLSSKLPKEAVKFAKSMGLDLDGLEPEAEDIWKMLDEMSRTNPIQYEQFVGEQLKSSKEEDTKTDPSKEKRSFRPAGGLKIRDVASEEGQKLYMNICGSVVIEEPTDKNGKPIVGTRSVADGLAIPLIVGPVRGSGTPFQSSERDMFVDVVFHPRVLELAASEQYFKAQIVDLALDWVIKEAGVDCKKKWEFVRGTAYKGGRGENGDVPVLFFVDADGTPVGPTEVGANNNSGQAPSKVLSSTSSLLSQLQKEKGSEQAAAEEKVDIFAATRDREKKTKVAGKGEAAVVASKKPLIQELGVSEPLPEPLPESLPPVPPAAHARDRDVATLGATGTALAEAGAGRGAEAETEPEAKPPSKVEFLGMERLLSSFDAEYANVSGPPSDPTQRDLEHSNTMIADLAKVLSGDLAVPSTAAGSSGSAGATAEREARLPGSAVGGGILSALKLRNDAPSAVSIAPTVESRGQGQDSGQGFKTAGGEEEEEGGGVLCLTLSGLSSSLDAAAMELLVSSEEVRVTLERRHLAQATGSGGDCSLLSMGAKCAAGSGYRLVEGSANASFKKKKGTLTVRIQYGRASAV